MKTPEEVAVWIVKEPIPPDCVPEVRGDSIVWRKAKPDRKRLRIAALLAGLLIYGIAMNVLATPAVSYPAMFRTLIVLSAITFVLALIAVTKK